MRSSRLSPCLAKRASKRGAAVFVVVLVVAMLSLIGLFAARASSLATQASGSGRQMLQTHYVTEYALAGVVAQLTQKDWGETMIRTMERQPDPACHSTFKGTCGVCLRIGNEDFNYWVKRALLPNPMFSKDTTTKPVGVFEVEMTDPAPSACIAGFDCSGDDKGNLTAKTVTLNVVGQVRTSADSAALSWSTSLELARAHVTVGPITK